MRPRATLASVMTLILVASFASTGLGAHTQQEIYVPSYVYPCSGTAGCAWDVFKTGATLVIINPASGPGTASNADYVNLVNTVKAGSSTVKIVLGYVSTNYGNRDSALVLADIDKYYSFYNVDGIFLDEGSTDCTKTSVYKSYDTRVKSKAGLGYTVLNWGVYGPECYLTSTHIDNYVNFENTFAQYTSAYASAVPSWVNKYDSSRFWNILHTAPNNATAVTQAVGTAKTRNVGQVYITNDVLSNPFDTAPASALWTAQVNKAKSCT
ncbi:uncharacterized protein [Physcomitrium patens]|nr:spherulin-4-like isoform X2 [Physcomitrium patens]XP_024377280.1 spherulin-4-like isoform X2 [Physcomitrium patens]XP_024377325.1 spherulin-4-like isoform X2 [Physcomitrium patens]XP_024377326.1 spherulin-4-like isoform X2 [Physcomitrium patens]|eukprot:XP_024377279.1 spherulin-4-like isoform X2 [Physcomitrella patens]